MKRFKSLIFIVTILILMIATFGCGGQQAEKGKDSSSSSEPAKSGPIDIAIGTGGTGGVYQVMGTAIANLINEKLGTEIRANPEPAPNMVQTTRYVDSGELDLGFSDAATVYYAVNGQEDFQGQPHKKIRTLYAAQKTGMALVVRADSDIKSLKDFKGKKIAVASNGTFLPTKIALEKLGIKPSDYSVTYLPFAQQAEALKNGTVDVAYQSAMPRSSALIDLTESIPVRFIPYEKEVADALVKDFPFYDPYPIPANTYKGLTENYPGIACQYLLEIINADVSEDIAYKIIKTVMENNDVLSKAHAAGKEFTLEQFKNYIEKDIITAPLHPGAVKYLKEKGINVPDKLIAK